MSKKEFALSASRLSSYLTCSWRYYMENVILLDDDGNSGQKRGSALHNIVETLIKPKYKERVQKIVEDGTVLNDKGIRRYMKMQLYTNALHDEIDHKGVNNFECLADMLYVILANDFYCEGWEIDYENLETKFTIKNEDPEYVIRGLIDKPAKKDGVYLIEDYKSSSSKKTDKELEFEVQALSYILYCTKILGAEDALVRFLFARFPEDPFCIVKNISKEQLRGFEHYLSDIYLYLKDFNEEKAKSNFAFDHGYLKDAGFKGKACCGYAKFDGHCYPDDHKDLDRRGQPYYACPVKFAFNYYSLRDEDGDIIKSHKDKDALEVSEGQYITEHEYKGCPKFRD